MTLEEEAFAVDMARGLVREFITKKIYPDETLPEKFHVDVIIALAPVNLEKVWRIFLETDLPDTNLYIVTWNTSGSEEVKITVYSQMEEYS